MTLSPMEMLAVAWPQPMSEVQVELYADALADLPVDEVAAAVRQLTFTEEWRPSIATIRRTVIEARQQFPDEGAAYRAALQHADVNDYVAMGAGLPVLDTPQLHPAVLAAYEAAGVDHQPSFRAAYREAREQLVRDAMTAPLALEVGS